MLPWSQPQMFQHATFSTTGTWTYLLSTTDAWTRNLLNHGYMNILPLSQPQMFQHATFSTTGTWTYLLSTTNAWTCNLLNHRYMNILPPSQPQMFQHATFSTTGTWTWKTSEFQKLHGLLHRPITLQQKDLRVLEATAERFQSSRSYST